MNKKTFDRKVLTQKYFGFLNGENDEPIVTTDINVILEQLGYDSKEEALEDISYWCYSSKSKTFNADIDGPTFTAGSTKSEVLKQIKMSLKGI
jgi:hypothetical protein